MALDTTHFFYADRGATSVYKFRVGEDPAAFVWFEYGARPGLAPHDAEGGPFRADDPLEDAPFPDLDALLAERGTTKDQWVEDLFAQYGDRVEWTYP